MHPNPAFRQQPSFLNLHMARKRGFGMLCVNGNSVPMISHVPFWLNDEGTEAEMHLVRSNPIARAIGAPTPAVIAVSGPDAYISPDWYNDPAQVPTWNYVAVHLQGQIIPADPDTMREHLDRLSARFEARLTKKPWTTDKMPDDVLDRMMRQILPFRFAVEAVDGTWKLNQNKTDPAREAAAEHVRTSPIGHEVDTLSWLMKGGVPEIDKGAVVTYI